MVKISFSIFHPAPLRRPHSRTRVSDSVSVELWTVTVLLTRISVRRWSGGWGMALWSQRCVHVCVAERPSCYMIIIIYHHLNHTMIHETVTSATDYTSRTRSLELHPTLVVVTLYCWL